jgi:DNA polymerase I
MPDPVGFDLETASADQLFSYGAGFIRLAGTITGDEIEVTTDVKELIAKLEAASWIYGHNIFGFDLLALALAGADYEALAAKSMDSLLLSRLDWPPEARDTGGSVDKYSLDAVAERLGVAGKTDSIKELAKKHGGLDQIPVDDEEYRSYLAGDLVAAKAVLGKLPKGAYAKREHKCQAIMGRMTLNGFRVDEPLLAERIKLGQHYKNEALNILMEDYDLPLGRVAWKGRGDKKEEFWETFESPLSTLSGREWLTDIYAAYGVRNPPLTDGDPPRLATAADALEPLRNSPASHPDLQRILEMMQTVTTTRTVYQTTEDHMVDGRVHPLINMGQASGRSSVTSPGLTVFGKRGGRHIERDVFLPEPGHVLISCDLSQVDMRGVAGLCQDKNYMALFGLDAEGNPRDPHKEIAIQLFGGPEFREQAKPITHGSNYGLGANKMIANGHDPQLVQKYFEERKRMFPRLLAWQDEMRAIGKAGKFLDNGWGRMMRCDPQRAYTQGPALMGQGCAADILKEAMLRAQAAGVPKESWRLMVHDEILFDVPESEAMEWRAIIIDAFTFEWRGVPITCDASKPGYSWGEVSAK